MVASSPQGQTPADPFVCAQNPPQSFTTDPATTTDSHATVTVHEKYAGNTSTTDLIIVLKQQGQLWKITGITCPPHLIQD